MIDSEYIAITLMMPKVGKKTALKIFKNLNYKISGYDDLYSHLLDSNAKFKTPLIPSADFYNLVEKYQKVNEENEKRNIKVISFFDEKYPKRFVNEDDCPVLLYCHGDLDLLNYPCCVGIIGTRQPYEKAMQLGQNLAKRFAESGFNIVSGLAVGCDTSGHLGALEGKGKTTAFLAHGLHMTYPKENSYLANRIVESGGLLVSEYPTGTPPLGNYFVERDRLQSYLSDMLVVVQSDVKGGTMHAVGTTLKSGKTLATIFPDMPDFRNHVKSRGNEYLIREKGAIPLITKEDINNLIKKFNPTSEKIEKVEQPQNTIEETPLHSTNNGTETQELTYLELKRELEEVRLGMAELAKVQQTMLKQIQDLQKPKGKTKNTSKSGGSNKLFE